MAYMQRSKGRIGEYADRRSFQKAERPAGDSPKKAPVSNSILQAKLQDAEARRSISGVLENESGTGREGGVLDAGSEAARFMGASSARGLDPEMNAKIGGKLGADFSGVRIHTDEAAQRAADSMNARAFTSGKDIYFNEGEYNPASPSGQRLLVHELTHTIQQGYVDQTTGSGENVKKDIPKEEDDTMAYAQTTRRGQTQRARLNGSTRSASGGASSVMSNSVMQMKLKIGGSRTPAEAEADRVASRVMSGDSANGSIPVTQSASAEAASQGTVQRDFLGFKKRYRKAVDELNDDFEGYKKQSRWERFKWTMANPIARMTARSKKNQENTKNRLAREVAIEKMAMEAQSGQADARTSIDQLNDDDRQSVFVNRGGGQSTANTPEEDTQDDSVSELEENLNNANQMELAGDKTSAKIQRANAVASGIGIGTSAVKIVKGGLQLANMGAANALSTTIPFMNLATSAIKGGASIGEISRAGKVRSRTTEGENKYRDDETKRGKSMFSLFHKGHNQAVNDQIAAGFDLTRTSLDAASTIASLSGVGTGAGVALGAASKAVDIGKGLFMKSRHKKMVKSEVWKDLGITDELIEQTRKQYQVNGKKLSRKEAEKFLLMKLSNSRSYEEAYLKNIRQQKEDVGTEGIAELKTAFGISENSATDEEKKAADTLMNQRMGVKKEDSEDLDASIDKRHWKKVKKKWSNGARGEGTLA